MGDLADLGGTMDGEFVGTATVNHQCVLQTQGGQSLRNDIQEFRLTDTQYLVGQRRGVHQGADEIEDRRVLQSAAHGCDIAHCRVILLREQEAETGAFQELRRRSGGEVQGDTRGLNKVCGSSLRRHRSVTMLGDLESHGRRNESRGRRDIDCSDTVTARSDDVYDAGSGRCEVLCC